MSMGELRSSDLSSLLPFLSEGFCNTCKGLLEIRLRNLSSASNGKSGAISASSKASSDFCTADSLSMSSLEKSPASLTDGSQHYNGSLSSSGKTPVRHYGVGSGSSPGSVTSRPPHVDMAKLSLNEKMSTNQMVQMSPSLSEEETELMRMAQVGRKKDFVHIDRVDGKKINILQGLELHTRVFNAEEQKQIVDCVYNLQRMGQSGKLRARTYTEPRKWMRGKGRVTIQFGCCYNYAVDNRGNPPGIIRDEDVDPMPPLLKMMIKRLIKWNVLPPTCVPNSCIVNIYDEGDCIPPHIDHHDFVRPFCTVSFLTESNILFGTSLKVAGPGEFVGAFAIPLPVGSVLILSGNGADVAKHCVPGVPGKRISITFRKMDDSKLPYKFSPDPELQGLRPLVSTPSLNSSFAKVQPSVPVHHRSQLFDNESKLPRKTNNPIDLGKDNFPPLGKDDFPPLGQSAVKANRPRAKKLVRNAVLS